MSNETNLIPFRAPGQEQEPTALSAAPTGQAVRININGVVLEIPDYLIQEIIAKNLPDLIKPGAALGAKERVMRLSFKGAMRLFLGYMEGQIIEKGAALPLPQIPTADDEMDVLEYGVYYILAMGLALLTRTDLYADAVEGDDGVLRVLRLAAGETHLDAAGTENPGTRRDADSGAGRPDDGSEPSAS